MLKYIDRHKFGLLGTILLHFFIVLAANYVKLPEVVTEQELVIQLAFEDPLEKKITEKPNENDQKVSSNDNSNKAVNESAPKNVKSGDYNQFNKEPSESSKQSFEEQLAQELKELEEQVIQDQREAGYGYSQEEIDQLLDSKKNMDLNKVEDQKPKSEAAFKGNTNITFKLLDRYDTKLKVPVYMCQYAGVVVVNIAVNPKGNVVSAKIDEESSKTTDPCLIEAALKSAKQTKFNNKSDAPKLQKGSITYRFLNQ